MQFNQVYSNQGEGKFDYLNKENVKRFLDEYVAKKENEGPVSSKVRKMRERLDKVTTFLMPGDIGFSKMDARRWLEGFMIGNKDNANNKNSLEPGFTAAQVSEMMQTDGVSGFLAKVTSMNAGRNATIMMRNQTIARESPVTHMVDVLMRKSAVTDFAFTMFLDTYFKYGVNLIQLFFPMSNTFSYLAVRGINGIATGGVNNLDELNIEALDYQLGGNDAFGRGLWKNIVYDVVKLGNTTLIAGFFYSLLGVLGFDDPIDPNNKFNWDEYRVGGNLGLGPDTDGDGKGNGLPVYAAWWLNDLVMWGLPAAYALKAHELHPEDEKLSWSLFKDGCYDMVSGASLLDMINLVNNAPKDFEAMQQMIDDPDGVQKPSDWNSLALIETEIAFAKAAGKMMPSVLKNWQTDTAIVGNDALDHTAYRIYNRASSRPGATQSVEDYAELLRRIESKHNPIYAVFNNVTKNGYLFDDGSTEKTGYLFDEMPIATKKDDQRMVWAERFAYDPDNIPGGEENRIPYTEQKIEEVIWYIDKDLNPEAFNSPEEAANYGFMIPWELREKMRDYCYQHINAAENIHNQKVADGSYANSAEKSAGYQEMSNAKQYYYNLLNNWVFNDEIPWTDEGYAKLLTDYQVVYTWKDGTPAAIDDYWAYGDEAVEKRYVPKGNHPTSFAPFTTPEVANRGYNFETVSDWYTEGESGTNLNWLFEQNEGLTVPRGANEGEEINSVIFGGHVDPETGETVYDSLNQPTMGSRGYVPFNEGMLDELRNVKREDVGDDSSLGELGKYKDKDYWTNNTNPNWYNQSWPSYGKRSYSSGSSNPKIYSNPRSISADRAATMYTKQPYIENNTYLRPGFSTKGSREAYKRQDI